MPSPAEVGAAHGGSPNTTSGSNLHAFYGVLVNTVIANVTTSFLWFALTFWIYLETKSVLATAVIGGGYMLLLAVLGVPFGTLVDRHHKKAIMVAATVITAVAYAAALLWFSIVPTSDVLRIGSLQFIVFVGVILAGAVVESMRGLALSTCVTLLVPDERRDKANGLVGMAMGLSFAITSVFSGLAIGQLGMFWTLVIAVVFTFLSLLHLLTVRIPEPTIVHAEGVPQRVDFRGAWEGVRAVPGLLGLVFFATFNNLLGGVFMALMDPYGLTLVSVEVWGILWGVLSFGFMIGSGWVATKGLGARPLRALLLANVAMWTIGIVFTIRESIWLTAVGILIYMALIPVAEAAEQTVLQRVVPFEKQGRVFGLAQSVEVAAAPVSAFIVGPVAQFWVIPSLNTPAGKEAFGWLLGDGLARGMALIFVVSGVLGLILTGLAFASKSYRTLTATYGAAAPSTADDGPPATG
ncbi:MAG: MFS transporter [Propionibacteriaceae bacterium]|nr:MFS transporter [Propionibacteriaceae bacterium]HBY22647.1 MFS transporter [Propionibacteriaceae bacterium]